MSAQDIDRFATLFSPPTPPASPILSPIPIQPPPPPPPPPPPHSPDSDFGSFVSVPPSEDPLASPLQEHVRNTSLEFFGNFAQEARRASERNKSILDELLQYEDDPLHFTLSDLNRESSSPTLGSTQTTPPPVSTHPTPTPSPTLDSAQTTPPPVSTHPTPTPSPTLSRTLTSRLMSSVLSLSPASPSNEADDITPIRSPPDKNAEATLHSYLPPHANGRASTLPIPIQPPLPPQQQRISHGSPFASHPYIPPTGAPGFAGDRNWDKGYLDDLALDAPGKGIRLEGRNKGTAGVIHERLANLIRQRLPPLMRLPRTWTLLYSIDQHGISLNTLYTLSSPPSPSPSSPSPSALIAIRDAHDTTFGAWIDEGVHLQKGGRYYGGGESFLWREDEEGVEGVKVWRWTGRNAYVALCEPGFIGFGGGDGHYGLYIDDTLLGGTSAWCPTFANEPLCAIEEGVRGEDVKFECVGLEVWAVGNS